MSKPTSILLASASPRRKDLLLDAGLRFTVQPVGVEEFEDPQAEPAALVSYNAQLKARAASTQQPEALVLGSDTCVFHKQLVLGKPRDLEDAREMLASLAGKTHTVYTAVALLAPTLGIDEVFCESSKVTFLDFDAATITEYFSRVNPLDKAGSYGIQEARELIIENVEGSVANVMGLPTERLLQELEKLELLAGLKR